MLAYFASEGKLWQAIKDMEEVVIILEDMAKQFEQSGQIDRARELAAKAEGTRDKASIFREYIFKQDTVTDDLQQVTNREAENEEN